MINMDGDMGLALEITPLLNIPIVLKIVIDVFKNLPILSDGKKYSFCVRFEQSYRESVKHIITYHKFPSNVYIYDSDGLNIFDIRGASGGITTSCAFYIIGDGK